ncbi:MAG: PAS domain S-box protein [bacterium]|nr:PAS domain S-box protein [bacterium]
MEKIYIKGLKENSDLIIDLWVDRVVTASSIYKTLPIKNIRKKVEKHFNALLDIYESDSEKKLNLFLKSLAKERHNMAFDVKETTLAFLNGQSVILSFLDNFRDGNPQFCTNCREITDSFNKSQMLYSDFHKKVILDDTKQYFEKEIKKLEKHFKSVAEGTSDAVLVVDSDLMIRYWNKGAEEIYGYTEKEVLGKHLSIIVPDDLLFKGELKNLSEFVSKKGQIKNYQTSRITKDKRTLTVDITASVLKDDQGKKIGFSTVHHNLTEQLNLENNKRSREQFLTNIVDNSVDAIIGLDLDDRILSWNKGAELIFGYKREEMLRQSFNILLPQDKENQDKIKFIQKALKKDGFIKNFEIKLYNSKGERLYTSLTRSYIREKGRKITGSATVIRDITEYKKLESQIGHSEKLSVIGQLAAGIAHEVGNPLTSISSLIQILVRTIKDDKIIHDLDLIKNQTDRITKLIRDLVTFSQPTDTTYKATDINTMISNAVKILKYDKRAKKCKITTNFSSDIPVIDMPEDQISQVIINLLLNSLDSLANGCGKIDITTYLSDDKINISIKDNGCGIPEPLREKIFEPFFTTKEIGKGTGLGLWISYSIINNLNGSISVDSELNAGTEFKIKIPLLR